MFFHSFYSLRMWDQGLKIHMPIIWAVWKQRLPSLSSPFAGILHKHIPYLNLFKDYHHKISFTIANLEDRKHGKATCLDQDHTGSSTGYHKGSVCCIYAVIKRKNEHFEASKLNGKLIKSWIKLFSGNYWVFQINK